MNIHKTFIGPPIPVVLYSLVIERLDLSPENKKKLEIKLAERDSHFSHPTFLTNLSQNIEDGLDFEEIVSNTSGIQGMSYSWDEGRYGFFDDGEGADTTLTSLQEIRLAYALVKLGDVYRENHISHTRKEAERIITT